MFNINELSSINPLSLEFSLHITNVSIDGREISQNGLYVPVIGDNVNGHHFIHQAIKNGAIASFWQSSEPLPETLPDNFCIIEVSNTLEALHSLANFYRNKVNPVVVGITGSNGKTSTKDILFSLVSSTYRAHKTEGNLNNHYGLPLTILSMPLDTEIAILEMGMSGFGEIKELSLIAEPDYAIVTNIGESHLEQLKTRENIAIAKLEIIKGLKSDGLLLYDGNEPLLNGTEGLSVGFKQGNSKIYPLSSKDSRQHFIYCHGDFILPLLGKHQMKNAAYAIEVASRLGIPLSKLKERLKNTTLTGMRLEMTYTPNGSIIVNDAYNASPTSMKSAIESMNTFRDKENIILVLGDMLELGENEEQMHRCISYCIDKPITHLFTLGKRAMYIADELSSMHKNITVKSFDSHADITSEINALSTKPTAVLLKGSRGMKLENVIYDLL